MGSNIGCRTRHFMYILYILFVHIKICCVAKSKINAGKFYYVVWKYNYFKENIVTCDLSLFKATIRYRRAKIFLTVLLQRMAKQIRVLSLSVRFFFTIT